MLDIYKYILRLKETPRSGWIKRGVKHPESIADHSFSVAFLTMIFLERYNDQGNIDKEKAIKMALLHDFSESITGDLTPDDKRYHEKEKTEKKILLNIFKNDNKICELIDDFFSPDCPEAYLVRQIDKFEMVLQSYKYNLFEEFYNNTEEKIKIVPLRQMLADLKKK